MNITKLHKIPGVDKNVCTAEQVVAYNFVQTYRRVWSAEQIAEYAKKYMAENPRNFSRFDRGAIYDLIRFRTGITYAGGIASSYQAIGEWFPLS